ncbi:unnamed protein product, partial [Staurois parvus]
KNSNKCILIALCESYSVYKLWYKYCNLRHFSAIQRCASLTDNCARSCNTFGYSVV